MRYIGYLDTTDDNQNVADNRNWQGSGRRSVANMFLELGWVVSMTEEQFQEEMDNRREMHNLTKNDHVIGCPLCMVTPLTEVEEAQLALQDAERAVREAEAKEASKKAANSTGGQ